MKKNVQINLCGRIFNIDEDAFLLLQKYIDTLHLHFDRKEGGSEIIDDIEGRICELFEELKSNGVQGITIEHVEEILNRIGSPQDLDMQDQVGANTSDAQEKTDSFRQRKLYRNPKDKIIAGVVSGFANYFDLDVTLLRFIVVLLFLVSSGTLLLAYILCIIIIPEAVSPEQQLKMRGEPVNISNLTEEVIDTMKDAAHNLRESGSLSSFGSVLKSVCLFFVKAFLVLLAVILFFCAAILTITCILVFIDPRSFHIFNWDSRLLVNTLAIPFMIYVGAFVSTLLIPAYGIIHSLIQRMSVPLRIFLIVTWLVTLSATITMYSYIDGKEDRREIEANETYVENIEDEEDAADGDTEAVYSDSLVTDTLHADV